MTHQNTIGHTACDVSNEYEDFIPRVFLISLLFYGNNTWTCTVIHCNYNSDEFMSWIYEFMTSKFAKINKTTSVALTIHNYIIACILLIVGLFSIISPLLSRHLSGHLVRTDKSQPTSPALLIYVCLGIKRAFLHFWKHGLPSSFRIVAVLRKPFIMGY